MKNQQLFGFTQHHFFFQKNGAGFTLVSALVYVALLAVILTVLTSFLVRIIGFNTQGKLAGEVLDSANHALSVVAQEVQHAQDIYDPTSIFDTHPGQLSLVTAWNSPNDEAATYVDFYIDDDRLYIKREGQTAELLTAAGVRVTNFQIEAAGTTANPTPADARAVRITLTIEPVAADPTLAQRDAVTVTSAATLRAY